MNPITVSEGCLIQTEILYSSSLSNASPFENVLGVSEGDFTLDEKKLLVAKLDGERSHVAASFSSTAEAVDYLRGKRDQKGT